MGRKCAASHLGVPDIDVHPVEARRLWVDSDNDVVEIGPDNAAPIIAVML